MPDVVVTKRWVVDGGVNLADLVDRLASKHGLRLQEKSATKVVLKGGSQLKMRALGGWFINDAALPKRIVVTARETDQRTELDVRLEDAVGVGFMDPKLRRKYERIFEEIGESCAEALGQTTAH